MLAVWMAFRNSSIACDMVGLLMVWVCDHHRQLALQPVCSPRPGPGGHQSRAVARRAPSASASNLAHTIVGWISGAYVACEEKPQSALATTFSRPTRSANRT